jgi:hypothetical protein
MNNANPGYKEQIRKNNRKIEVENIVYIDAEKKTLQGDAYWGSFPHQFTGNNLQW